MQDLKNQGKLFRPGAFSWVMYDWANSAFYTTVVAGFFPAFFDDYWSAGMDSNTSTAILGYTVAIASAVVALLAPVLGSFADKGSRKKRFLFFFTALGVLMTAGFYFVDKGDWPLAATLYVIAFIGVLGSVVFYDSLIVSVSDETTVDKLSGLGFSIGYLGGGMLFLVNVLMFLNPQWFGFIDAKMTDIGAAITAGDKDFGAIQAMVAQLPDQFQSIKDAFAGVAAPAADAQKELYALITDPIGAAKVMAIKISFLMVAIWWAVFSIPIFLNVKEPGSGHKVSFEEAFVGGFKQLGETFNEIRKYKIVLVFLFAYWFYIDGVDTIITMAVKYGKSIGFATGDLIAALLLVQFVGFPFAWIFGWLGGKYGSKRLLFVGIFAYIVITVLGANLSVEPWDVFGFKIPSFYLLAGMVGMVQGGIQALSRSYYAKIIPPDKAGEFFGFYNMLGKFASIIGPLLMGSVGLAMGDTRYGILSVSILFVIGGGLLYWVSILENQKKKAEL
ncbi:MAG: MFS transporter [Leptospiraceae bacterium]|nr:MFS transporter [Leptospiraceae bacterium]MCB1170981.1 MFS transporter [Leptospiraceae bacterium]